MASDKDVFFPHSEIIMRNLEGYLVVKVERDRVNNLRYADTVFIAENKEDLQQLLDIVEEDTSKKGWE